VTDQEIIQDLRRRLEVEMGVSELLTNEREKLREELAKLQHFQEERAEYARTLSALADRNQRLEKQLAKLEESWNAE
jgi:hypothetical protein